MTFWTLIRRSLRFHARAHVGVVLGAAVGSAALVGALVVGDSVSESLKEQALARLGRTTEALVGGDRLFRAELGGKIHPAEGSDSAAVLQLPGIATADNGSARANHVQILGVDRNFWPMANRPPDFGDVSPDSVVLNQPLAQQLKAKIGDTVLLRVDKPSLLSRDAPVSPQEDYSVALRLKVQAVVGDEQFGRFGLQANQVAPFNAFVNLAQLGEKTGQTNRANLILVSDDAMATARDSVAAAETGLRRSFQLADAELQLRELPASGGYELRSDRIFLDPPVVEAARRADQSAQPIITYLVNELRAGDKATPYSMVTAMGAPVVPADMKDDEILINDWLADDLGAKAGDHVSLSYYVMGNGRLLEERTNVFRVRSVVPLAGAAADRTLMPDFPGVSQAESSRDWDAGFPILLSKIRDKDDQYWKEHRGTPKAFVTLAVGQKMWANRFGEFTAIRFGAAAGGVKELEGKLLAALTPASVGLQFQPVREQALAATEQVVPFGELFLSFSFFLIAAALLLMGLLFQFGLEQRAVEVGTLLALGFRPRQVRRLLLGEGVVLALLGGVVGAAGGILYAAVMLHGLTTVWRDAVGTSALGFHATVVSVGIGTLAGAVVAALTIWVTLWRQARKPARELLNEGDVEPAWRNKRGWKRHWPAAVGTVAAISALGMVGGALWQKEAASADTFFSAGTLLLIAGLAFCATWLGRLAQGAKTELHSLAGLGLRGSTRRGKRSLATIGLLACGAFLIVAVGAFRLDANENATKRSSGTGGFALIGSSTLPITYDLNGKAGRDFYGLNFAEMKDVSVVAFRVRDGDEASCLNLNRAQRPRLLGVNPEALQQRKAFTFSEVMKGLALERGWTLLKRAGGGPTNADEIPAIGDENSIQWSMGKSVGDTIDYTDEQGRVFKLRLVASVANSILQGSLIIDEAEFVKRFPGETGYRMFLVDAPAKEADAVAAGMTRALSDAGLELVSAPRRLNAFNAVQNTYLSTFQVLGGLGLLLGSAGLGVVVLRNVRERRGELGLMLAVGFRRRALEWLVLSEHGALLGMGLILGALSAAIAVLPALTAPGSGIPWASLGVTLGAVLLNGLAWTWVATRLALRGRLVDALRNE